MKKLLMLAIAAIATLSFLGCGAVQVYNVNNNPIVSGGTQKVSKIDVEKSIIRAGAGMGWVMKKVRDGEIQGTLTLRTHTAIVSIRYNQDEYSINYVDSMNLEYNSAANTIHKNYNGWIQNLNKSIQVQLSLLGI